MLYPESSSPCLDPDLFRHPNAHYRGIPFWSWNCRITRELIDEQLPLFQRMGFGGVVIHSRSGLDTVYLGSEYMDLVRYAINRCGQLGLLCWLYDDDRFPSGAAGGLVTRDPKFRQRFLLLTEHPRPDCMPDQFSFDEAIRRGEIPAGWYAASYAIGKNTFRRLTASDPARSGETVRYAYVMLLETEDWFQGQTYVDIMHPSAVRRFINLTHEAYLKEVGSSFGNTVTAIFTDEPRMETRTRLHPKHLKSADDRSDVILPWSEPLRNRLLKDYQTDLLDIAPLLLWDLPGSFHARYIFRNAAGEQFVTAFMDQIAAWCNQHHLFLTGHVLSEDTLYAQATALGDCMRCYRGMDIPGIDILCDDRQFLTVKQAASVAHQMGREGVASELYGVTEWNCTFKTFKLQGDWQAALGVTARVPHLAWMSMEGEAKRDWPGSIFFQSPCWTEYSSIEDYFARLNTVLTRGYPMIDVAVLHPVESMWLHLGTVEKNLRACQELDDRFKILIQSLLLNLIDFDLLSESLLPSLKPFCDEEGLHIGAMNYRTIVIPDLDTIRSSTLNLLEAFHRQGGLVICAGKPPALVDALPSDRAKNLFADCPRVDHPADLAQRLDVDISILDSEGLKSNRLLAQRRKDNHAEWLFLCHAFPCHEVPEKPEIYTLRIRGHYSVRLFDPMNGQISPMPAQHSGIYTMIRWEAWPEDSLLLQLTEGISSVSPPESVEYHPFMKLTNPDSMILSDPNVLLLDYARARVDGGPVSEKTEILKLDNSLRQQLGFCPRYGGMAQPYAIAEKETHALSLYYEIISEIDFPCCLALEHPERCRIRWNGQNVRLQDTGYYVDKSIRTISMPSLKKGMNSLELHLPYHQKTNLENIYLLGNFDVQLRPAGSSLITPASSKEIGDLTRQGLPFWSGAITYSFVFSIEEAGKYSLRIPLFAAQLLTVRADGHPAGQMAFAPHRLSLDFLSTGKHRIDIIAYIGRHNGFGYLHNNDPAFRWFGPDAWRTEGHAWTDDYRLKPGGILSAVYLEKVIPVK